MNIEKNVEINEQKYDKFMAEEYNWLNEIEETKYAYEKKAIVTTNQ